MKILAPSYYPRFKCIAGACRHSCCIGWEIAVDNESYQKYALADGGSGRILNHIVCRGGEYMFKTGEDGRCPFLNPDGLCRLIIDYGEESLSEICREHPRFRSFFSSITEIGLGLSCEEAARIILTDDQPFSLIVLSDDGKNDAPSGEEEEFFLFRDSLISLLESPCLPLDQKISALFSHADCDIDKLRFDEAADFLLTLERLDNGWGDLLLSLKNCPPAPIDPACEHALLKMCVYFVYRHMPEALYSDDYLSAVLFSAFLSYLACQLARRLCSKKNSLCTEDLVLIAGMISSELEYSDENPERITEMLLAIYS